MGNPSQRPEGCPKIGDLVEKASNAFELSQKVPRKDSRQKHQTRGRQYLPCTGWERELPIRIPALQDKRCTGKIRSFLDNELLEKARFNFSTPEDGWRHLNQHREPPQLPLLAGSN